MLVTDGPTRAQAVAKMGLCIKQSVREMTHTLADDAAAAAARTEEALTDSQRMVNCRHRLPSHRTPPRRHRTHATPPRRPAAAIAIRLGHLMRAGGA